MSDEVRAAYGGARLTEPRRAIAKEVADRSGAFTIDELAESVRRSNPAAGATATVYRAIAAMEAAGFVERVGSRAGSVLFTRCNTHAHHHHIVCDGCGRIAHADCPVPFESAPARDDGFIITRHEVTLYGLCPSCAGPKVG